MKFFRDLGIQKKMQLMTLVICSAVLLVAISVFVTFQILSFRANFEQDTTMLAVVIANNSTAAMAFENEADAAEVVSALSANPAVISATLLAPDGSIFAHWGKAENKNSLNHFPMPTKTRFIGGQLLVAQPVVAKGERVGVLCVRADYQRTFLRLLWFYGKVVAGVILVSATLGWFLSRRLSRTITSPVLELAQTARIVGEKKDYSVRAASNPCRDELGTLTESFNEMLNRIQLQDAAISLSQKKMEALINSIDGIVWERSPDTFHFTFVSRQSETILGYPPHEWLGESTLWTGKLHPQDAAKTVQASRDLAAHGPAYSLEYRMVAADGRTVWIRESGMVLLENGRRVALRGILLDITRQKQDAEQLDKLNRRLMDTSRQAGMADVATGVLHNVGNVLNSVSVAATVVGERLEHSKVGNLQRATAMLREQNGQLAGFLTSDPKGKLLPVYLDTVAGELAEERKDLIAEVKLVAQNIEHIKEIVAMQQSYAKVSGAYENLSPTDLVEDALRINITAFDRHGIAVTRNYAADLPMVCVDRHKVLQILINVLRNAKHAMEELPPDHKRLAISITSGPEGRIRAVVRDYGIGIPPENMTKIFNHGFTTKKDGHGFGLHSGANAAREMGGSLTAHSDGPGKGAEFTLELPIVQAPKQDAPVAIKGVA
jgi:PAS domain S-box-containing protein